MMIWQPAVGGHGPEAVFLRAAQVLQRIFVLRLPGYSVLQSVRKGWPLVFAQVCHHLGVVRAQESQVAQLTKVHLDGHELAVHINARFDTRRNAQAAQFSVRLVPTGHRSRCNIQSMLP